MTYARVAGCAFLVYIVAGLVESSMFGYALGSGRAAVTLASLSEHAWLVRLSSVFAVTTTLSALVLAVALFAITRQHDLDLAVLALCARGAEAAIGAVYTIAGLAMLSVTDITDGTSGVPALLALSSTRDGAMVISAICFAFGSTVFSYLLLRGRLIPMALGWLGLVASVILVVALPLQMALGANMAATWYVWLPMLIFEFVVAWWLIVKGLPSAVSTRRAEFR